MNLKYVFWEGCGFITWPNSNKVWHSMMVQAFHKKLGLPTSAGFIRMAAYGPECYGRSESLNLDSLPTDTAMYRRLHGYKAL